jgi:hypothetical protein
LIVEKGYATTSHPRSLAATLLSDWVFTQHPKSVREVMSLALDGSGLKLLLAASDGQYRSSSSLVLPNKCGGDILVKRCFEILRGDPPIDYAHQVLKTAKANAGPEELKALWMGEALRGGGQASANWLRRGGLLGVLEHLTEDEMNRFCSLGPLDVPSLVAAMHAGKADFVEAHEPMCRAIVDAVLDVRYWRPFPGETILDQFAAAFHPLRYARAFLVAVDAPLEWVWRNESALEALEPEKFVDRAYSATLQACLSAVASAKASSLRPTSEWANELAPWNGLVEGFRSVWGERLAIFFMANVASGIRSSTEKCSEFSRLLDNSQALCKRCRYARLRAGSVTWWRSQLSSVNTSGDSMLVSLLLLTWGSPSTLGALCGSLQPILDHMPPEAWSSLIRCTLESVSLLGSRMPRGSISVASLPEALSPRTVAALATRTKGIVSRQLYDRYLSDYKGSDPVVLDFCQEQALDVANIYTSKWRPNLELLASTYAQGVLSSACQEVGVRQHAYPSMARVNYCEAIVTAAEKFPMSVVRLAETICRNALTSKIIPVAEVAKNEGWFA